jgi:hypothetical protein
MCSIPPGTEQAAESEGRKAALYASSSDGLKAVKEDFLYWTGKLTDSSFELSLGLIAANWAAFGSVQKILSNIWAKSSLAIVIATLVLGLVGAKIMSELHRRRINYAGQDRSRWEKECAAALGRIDPWPFTKGIDVLGRCLREIKTWLPLLAGAFFLVALFTA